MDQIIRVGFLLTLSILSASLTFWLGNQFKLHKVLTSAGISLVVALIFQFMPQSPWVDTAPVVCFGASFCGMSSRKVINQKGVALAGLIFGLFYWLLPLVFKGLGGGLGTTASVSVLASIGLLETYKLAHTWLTSH